MSITGLMSETLTPSQKARQTLVDYKTRQARAEADAAAINARIEREAQKAEAKQEEALMRLVDGSEVTDWRDVTFLADLYLNQGDADGKASFEYNLSNAYNRELNTKIGEVRVAQFKKEQQLEADFLKYVAMTDKRDTKKLVESFKGTGFESLVNAIDGKVAKRPTKKVEV